MLPSGWSLPSNACLVLTRAPLVRVFVFLRGFVVGVRFVAGLVMAAGLCLVGAPAFADDYVPDVVVPDQPEWEYEWRDREYTVVCDGENSTRIVIQSMWRPSEPRWDGTEWVTFDDWHEWAWPKAMQTVYKPIEPGDCPTAEAVTPNTPGPRTELAVTGSPVLFGAVAAAGIALVGAGVFMIRRGVRQ